MSETAFNFLLKSGSQPFRPSTCYVVADPNIKDRKAWTVELEEPPSGGWFIQIDDLKDWILHGSNPVRKMFYDRTDHQTAFREIDREELFRQYLRKILSYLSPDHQQRRKYALMPSISDETSRSRYRNAIEAALPNVTIMPEPEMVAEYFRLVTRTLKLESGANNVILVLDVGASTADMTIVVSRRDETIIDIDKKGAQRDQRIRALRGDSLPNAGRWVDKRIAELLSTQKLCSDDDREKDDQLLRSIEKAKVIASQTGVDTTVNVPPGAPEMVIDQSILRTVSKDLAGKLGGLFGKLCERLYDNFTATDDAMSKSEPRLRERGVNGRSNAYRLVDFILLAGGTSLLPGFEQAMLSTFFPDDHQPKVLHVGMSFAIAAAAGGLAHRLHNYTPPRIRALDENGTAVFTPALESTLPHPLFIGIKQPSKHEQQVEILDPNDPFVDVGGKRPIEGLPYLSAGSRPKMRLIPGGAAGVEARRGRKFEALEVTQSPGNMSIEWDPIKQRAMVSSDQVQNTQGHLWMDVGSHRQRDEPAVNPFLDKIEPGMLAIDQADDVVLDFGMSKIVAMTADRGWTSAEELERVIHETAFQEHLALEYTNFHGAPNSTEPHDLGDGSGLSNLPDLEPVQAEKDQRIDTASDAAPTLSLDGGDPAGNENLARNRHSEAQETKNKTQTDWGTQVSDTRFSNALKDLQEAWKLHSPQRAFDDVVVALLALSVRPIVVFAGPPGCGKSTLARTVSYFLGTTPGETFHEIAVQAHWENDNPLFGDKGLLSFLLADQEDSHLVLFDEFNLTRPEYYLSRMFHALDSGRGMLSSGVSVARYRLMGTMNIDDASRPPSPKVIDRCFLVELDQIDWNSENSISLPDLSSMPPLPGLPVLKYDGATADPSIDNVLKALQEAVSEKGLRSDILPSRRVLSDTKALLGLHHRLDLEAKGIIDRRDIVDRVLASRVLVKLSGAFDQIKPALDALEKSLDGLENDLPRTHRRLRLARQQSELGFISPWQ